MPESTPETPRQREARRETLIDIARRHAAVKPGSCLYTFLDSRAEVVDASTYGELDLRARTLASALREHAAPRARILLAYLPGLDFVRAFIGTLYAGMIPVPVYPPQRKPNEWKLLESITLDAETEILLTDSAYLERYRSFIDESAVLSRLRVLATDHIEDDAGASSAWTAPELDADDIAFIQYTSGSTGTPKGVMVTHGNLQHNLELIRQRFGHSASSQGVIWLPPYHDMGLVGGVLEPLYCGFPVALMSPVTFVQKPYTWLLALSRYRGTTSGGPSFAYDQCVRRIAPEKVAELDLGSWDVAFNGAEPISAAVMEAFVDKFAPVGFRREAFYPCYGMAEATLMITGGDKAAPPRVCSVNARAIRDDTLVSCDEQDPAQRSLVGCGVPGDDTILRIVDPDTGTPLPPNRIGEIWVSGPSMAAGYWNRPGLTEESFHARLSDSPGKRFFRTGDLGAWIDGELVITGRRKEMIIIRGKNHYPQDLEGAARASHPALEGMPAAAFSVLAGDEERLVLVHEVRRTAIRRLDVSGVIASIQEALIAQHGVRPHDIVLVGPYRIPTTSSGKVRRAHCKQLWQSEAIECLGHMRAAVVLAANEERPTSSP